MPKTGKEVAQGSTGNGQPAPASLEIAAVGVRTSRDFRDLMSAIMSDVIGGKLTPSVTNAACNAGGKLLKMVELEMKYATEPQRSGREISVAFEDESPAHAG